MSNYYIKTGGDNGKDGLSEVNAWATVGKVTSEWESGTFNPDDIISFNRGDLWTNDELRIKSNSIGTSGHPITVGAYGAGNKPRFTGTFAHDAGIVISSGNGIEYIDIEDIWIDESNDHGVHVNGINMGNINFNRITVTDSVKTGILVIGIDTYSIEDCVVSNAGHSGIVVYGSEVSPITNGLIKGNIVHDSGDDGITLHRDGSSFNIGPNHVLENNISYDNGEDNYDITAGTNIILRNNHGYGNSIVADGISMGSDIEYIYIENHYSRNEERFLYVNDASRIVISKCRTYNCTDQDIDFGSNDSLEDVYLANNSFVVGEDNTRPMLRIQDVSGTTTTDIRARNNIFTSLKTAQPSQLIGFTSPATPTSVSLDFDYNRYYRADGDDTQLLWFGGSWANWQGVEGQDVHGAYGDPGLVDPASDNYKSGVVCRDAGTWLTTITSATGSGTSFVVSDALWFHDGFGIVSGTKIRLEGKKTSVTITDVNYGTNTITVDGAVSWTVGDGVALEFFGLAPDAGFYEHIEGGLSDYLEDELIDHVFKKGAYDVPTNIYIALCKSTVLDSSTGGSLPGEVSGGAYARVACNTWDAASDGVTANSQVEQFNEATADWGTITHFALCDHSSTGHVLAYGVLDIQKGIREGKTAKFITGELDVTLS